MKWFNNTNDTTEKFYWSVLMLAIPLVEIKICFISDTSNGVGVVGGVDSYPKADFPSLNISGQELL